ETRIENLRKAVTLLRQAQDILRSLRDDVVEIGEKVAAHVAATTSAPSASDSLAPTTSRRGKSRRWRAPLPLEGGTLTRDAVERLRAYVKGSRVEYFLVLLLPAVNGVADESIVRAMHLQNNIALAGITG